MNNQINNTTAYAQLSEDCIVSVRFYPAEFIPSAEFVIPAHHVITLHHDAEWFAEENIMMPPYAEEITAAELLAHISEDKAADLLEEATQLYVESTWAQY